jgi:uncharacterized protein (DUF924 family)
MYSLLDDRCSTTVWSIWIPACAGMTGSAYSNHKFFGSAVIFIPHICYFFDMRPNKISQIIEFWFSDRVKPLRFNSTAEFDREIKDRYFNLWQRAREGDLEHWKATKEGCLALVLLLDQFPLHMFRGQADAFATEQLSRDVAESAIDAGFQRQMPEAWQAFLYLPFMHSESLADQDRSVALFESAGLHENLKWAIHHREIVRRFGRFPHRNEILGRESSVEELVYLRSDQAFLG